MSLEWKIIRRGDSCLKIGSGATPQGGKESYLESGTYSLFRSQNVHNDGFKIGGLVYLNDAQAKKLQNVAVEIDDVLLNITGDSVARVCLAPAHFLPARVNQHVAIIRPKAEFFDSRFIRYFLASPVQQNLMLGLASTGGTRNALTKSMIEDFKIPCPSLSIQKQISDILSALDDRITLLRETNATLEAIAQALFKSWFVDFDPVHAKAQGTKPEGMDDQTAALFPDSFEESELGMVPAGWEVGTLDDVCDFQNGYAFKSTEMSKSKEDTYKIFKMGNIKKGGGLNRSGTKDYFEKSKSKNLDRYLLKKGDLLMCMTDMKNNVVLLGHTALMDIDDEFLVNQRVGMLRSKNKKIANFPFLYLLTNSDFFIADLRTRANSGVQVNLSTQEIKNTKFVLPPEKIHQRFNEVTEAIYEKLFILEQQQDSLANLRDTLLPRLISGQLRLPDVVDHLGEI
jgi:type I restriction enzyme S subunit